MSYRDRLAAVNDASFDALVAFCIEGRRVGWLLPAWADRLSGWPDVFVPTPQGLGLHPRLDDPASSCAERSRAVAPVLEQLGLAGWRDELFPVGSGFDAPAVLHVERAAIPIFGARGYGVHVNGVVGEGPDLHMWVARRAADKPTWPGTLDQMVAGGQPAGLGVFENLIKECDEEAGLDADLAARARPAGTVSYCMATPLGVRPDLLFVYDLQLPTDFVPRNRDGEVAAFELLPIDAVAALVRNGPVFKPNCALVVIDFLVRRGYIDPDSHGYEALVAGLRRDPPV